MYKVFVNQNVIVLTNKVQFGTKITVLPLKETSLGDIIKKLKKRKTIFVLSDLPKFVTGQVVVRNQPVVTG